MNKFRKKIVSNPLIIWVKNNLNLTQGVVSICAVHVNKPKNHLNNVPILIMMDKHLPSFEQTHHIYNSCLRKD